MFNFENLETYLHELNFVSITLRLLLALLFGGIIGLERGSTKHPAGFRTHILVCLGAAVAMLTNQFIINEFTYSDPARLGAQVITGVGFLGVGTILITGQHRIKGLTTAAGLWACACVSLAIGIGFYQGAIIAGIIIFVSLTFLPKIEKFFYEKSRLIELYIEVDTINTYQILKSTIKKMEPSNFYTTILKSPPLVKDNIALSISLLLTKKINRAIIIQTIEEIEGVSMLEEL